MNRKYIVKKGRVRIFLYNENFGKKYVFTVLKGGGFFDLKGFDLKFEELEESEIEEIENLELLNKESIIIENISDEDEKKELLNNFKQSEKTYKSLYEKFMKKLTVMIKEEEKANLLFKRKKEEDKKLDIALDELKNASLNQKRINKDENNSSIYNVIKEISKILKIDLIANNFKTDDIEEEIENITRFSNIRYRRINLNGNWWKKDSGALLGFLKKEAKPILIYQNKIYDLENAEEIKINSKTSQSLMTVAYCFYKNFKFESLNFVEIMNFLKESLNKGDLFKLLFISSLSGLLISMNPVLIALIFDRGIPEAEINEIVYIALFLVIINLNILIFNFTKFFLTLRLNFKISSSFHSAVWDRLLSMNLKFFKRYSSGDLALRANSIRDIKEALSADTIMLLLTGIFSIFNIILMFYYSVSLAFLALILISISFIFNLIIIFMKNKDNEEVIKKEGEISSFLFEAINSIEKFKVYALEKEIFSKWASLFSQKRRKTYKMNSFSSKLGIFHSVYPLFSMIIIFYISGKTNQQLSIGKFISFFSIFMFLLYLSMDFLLCFEKFVEVLPHIKRLKPLFEAVPEYDNNKSKPGKLKGEIELNSIYFKYGDKSPLILKDVSFKIKAGEFLAVVGPSGSGKSTLLRLMLAFEKPVSGSIYYDKKDLEKFDIKEIRRQIGVVLQENHLIPGDIFNNISGGLNITMEEAWEAADSAGLADDIEEMPMGMNTVINDGGVGFSGGQIQKILIARSIVSKPKIMFFDEATSALDNISQEIVKESIAKLNVTRIVIAHRLSTIIDADRIILLKDGEIAEMGTYEELMELNGYFSEMAKRQNL